MVKGITKRIIEINNTRNEYFEKVILFVRQDRINYPKKFLEAQANDCISDILGNKKTEKKKHSPRFILLVIAGIIITSAVCTLVMLRIM